MVFSMMNVEAGEIKEAILKLEKSIQIKPDYLMTNYALGKLLTDLGETERSIVCFRSCLLIKPDDNAS